MTIQDPIVAKLSKLESMFRNCPAGLASPVKLRKVEVSVDFIPHNFGDAEREAMVVALQRTYLPQPDVWKTRMSRPRFS